MDNVDIAVVGAGIHGASAAYHLAERGVRVAVLERTVPAGGPTGRSGAIVRAYYTNRFLAETARDSIEMFHHFGDLTDGGDCGFRQVGGAFLHAASDLAQCRAVVEQLTGLGIGAEWVDGDALGERLPGFALDDVAVAVWEPGAGYADPSGTTLGLISKAMKGGAALHTFTAVRRLEAGTDHVALTTDGGVLRADRVLVAAGPWTAPLLRQIGVDLPLVVERHAVASWRYGPVTPVPHVIGDLSGGCYIRPDGEAAFQLGALHATPQVDPDAFEAGIHPHESAELAAAAIRRVPRLEDARQAGGWASLYDVSPDWQPVIGQVAERVFVDAGTSGHGFKLAPALGRHVAGLVAGDDVHPGLAQFDPARFTRDELLTSGYGEARILG